MRFRYIAGFLAIVILFTADLPARRVRHRRSSVNAAAIRQKKSELAQLRAQINAYQNQLDRLNKTEHSSVRAFEAYTHQAHLLKNLIEELNGEEERLTSDIAETQQQISSSQQTLKELKAQYARAVVSLYKRGTEGDLEVLLSSHNINEAVERSEYLRQFTIYRQRLADNIQATVSDLQDQQTLLTQQRDEKASIAGEKVQEQQELDERASERSKLIEKIRSDKSSLKETLTRAQKSSREIESLISRLVMQSERKKNSRADRTPLPAHPRNDRDFDDIARQSAAEEAAPDHSAFGMLRGSLGWPCASHRIAEHFGERVNPTLGTVTVNLGVDIKSPKNSDVFAVADGTVSLVYWLPSYGTILILDHHNGYRTVYANLAEATVKEGQRVRARQIIGKSDASAAAGEVVHFEIWKDRDKQNPENWLAKR